MTTTVGSWRPSHMVARAMLCGLLTGGGLGATVTIVLVASDGGTHSLVTLLSVLAIYTPAGFLVGAILGLLEALVAVGLVLSLQVRESLATAQAIGAIGALVLPAIALLNGFPVFLGVPFAAVSTAGAALWMPRVIGRAP